VITFTASHTGLSDGRRVTQTDIVWKHEGEDATMSCSSDYWNTQQMYWFRQLPGETIKLIVFTRRGNKVHDFGDFSTEKFSATKPVGHSGTFTVKNLQPEDNGLYFCAVSHHSDTESLSS